MEYSPVLSDYIDNDTTFMPNISNMSSNLSNICNIALQGIEPVSVIDGKCEESIVIKDLLQDALQTRDELTIDNDGYKNEEIDSIVTKIESFAEEFKILQEELDVLHNEYVIENGETKMNVGKINSSIKYMLNMEQNYEIDENLADIFEKMNDYSKKIQENDKLIETKSKYVEKRKELNSYLYFIRKINKWNTSAICPICITDSIDSYCNPCGHTACRKCLDRHGESGTGTVKCPICRDNIMEIRKLFFL
jgi:hypothetical protein